MRVDTTADSTAGKRTLKMKSMHKKLGIAMLVISAGAISLFAAKPSAAAGKAVYASKCEGCHAATGKGQSFMANSDLTAPAAKKKSNAALAAIIRKGAPPMPSFSSLSASEIHNLVAYVRELQHQK